MMNAGLPNTLRKMNATLVLNVIRQHGPLSRAQVAKISGITKATVSDIISGLIQEGTIYEEGVSEQIGQGRKGVLLHFAPYARLGVGIDLGGTKVTYSVFNLNAEILYEKRESTWKTSNRDLFIECLINGISDFIDESGVDRNRIGVIGLATPGIIDISSGVVLEGSPNLPDWVNLPLAKLLTHKINIPVVLENDIRAALVGEIWCGKCRDINHAALIGIGTGLGSALLVDGKIIRGKNNAAGEIGYMIFGREQLFQDWRNKGCFESFCSGSGMNERIYGLTHEAMSFEEIILRVKQNDLLACALIDEMADYLAMGIINLVAIANLQKIILTGGVSHAHEYFLPRVQAILDKQLCTNTHVSIELSDLREKAPLYGIAILALSTIYPSIEFIPEIQLH